MEKGYQSKNYAKWQNYITIAFYSLTKQEMIDDEQIDIPYLTFGISTQNTERYKNLFAFLIFSKLDNYLNDRFLEIDTAFDLKKIIYGSGKNEQNR